MNNATEYLIQIAVEYLIHILFLLSNSCVLRMLQHLLVSQFLQL